MRFWETPKKELIKPLLFDENGNEMARMRVRLFIIKGKLENYVVQLEYKYKKLIRKWVPVVRHNCYHGFCHKDIFTSKGERRKENLGRFKDLNEAVGFAVKDISENFEKYIKYYEGE